MIFDTVSKLRTRKGEQRWRFRIDEMSAPTAQWPKHYLEVMESYQSYNSNRMVTKNVCIRMDNDQLRKMWRLLEAYFEGEEE